MGSYIFPGVIPSRKQTTTDDSTCLPNVTRLNWFDDYSQSADKWIVRPTAGWQALPLISAES